MGRNCLATQKGVCVVFPPENRNTPQSFPFRLSTQGHREDGIISKTSSSLENLFFSQWIKCCRILAIHPPMLNYLRLLGVCKIITT